LSKDSLVKGTIILAVAALVARVFGLVQRVPLQHLLHNAGMGTFGLAFNIYNIMLLVATAGIPSALSKLVSERVELGQYAEANRIYKAAVYFALIAGVIMTVLVYLLAPMIANFSEVQNEALSVRALAPALLLFPLIAIMRGYFQGRRSMMPNGLSQIAEQIMRLITAIGLAYLLLQLNWGPAWVAAGASFGGVMGGVGALAIMVYYAIKLRRNDQSEGLTANDPKNERPAQTYKQIYLRIFRISLPIVLYSIVVPLIYVIDSTMFKKLLHGLMSAQESQDFLGVLTARAQSFAGIPLILAIALSQSIVPIISSAFARKDLPQVRIQATKALRLSVFSGLPFILFIVLAARPLNMLLFGDDIGTGLIISLTATTLLQILMQTSGAILMGLGQMRVLIIHVFIGIALKLASLYFLASGLGIYAFIVSTAICFGVMMLLNMRVLKQITAVQMFKWKHWGGLIISVAIICACGILLESFNYQHIVWFPHSVNHFLNASIIGIVVIILYFALLLLTRVVTKEDIAAFPAPLRKILGKASSLLAKRA
jgi:stage V sporulation protein B